MRNVAGGRSSHLRRGVSFKSRNKIQCVIFKWRQDRANNMTSWARVGLTTLLLWKRKSQRARFKLLYWVLKFTALLQNTHNKSRLPLLASGVGMGMTLSNSCQAKDQISFILVAYSFRNMNTGHKQESNKCTTLKSVTGEQKATQTHVYNGARSLHSSGENWKRQWRQNIDTGTEVSYLLNVIT